MAPEASDVLTHHAQVREQLGFDPAAADQALSLAARTPSASASARSRRGCSDQLVASAEVESSEDDGGETVTRAEVRLPDGARPGLLLLAAFARGSLLTYLGAPRPIPRG